MIGVSNKWTDKEREVLLPIIQYRYLVKNYKDCLDFYESLYPSITSTIKDDVVMSSGGNSMEDKMMNILDHRAHCKVDLEKQMEVIIKIDETVNSLPPDEQFVIRRYYMRGVTMEDIADEIPASIESCWRLRRQAVSRLLRKLTVNDSVGQ